MIEKFEPEFEKFDDPFQAYLSKDYRNYISGCSINWLSNIRNWNTFSTLTFKEDVSDEFAMRMLKGLIRSLNQGVFGNNYTRLVGHSYFSYICGVERQERGTPHFHILFDRSIDYERLWEWWFTRCGYVKTIECGETVTDRNNLIGYLSKYITKDGELIIFLAERRFFPPKKFSWWKEDKPTEVGNYSFGFLDSKKNIM